MTTKEGTVTNLFKNVYAVGWNLAGCLPEVPPVNFDTLEEAEQYVKEAREFGVECYGSEDKDPYVYWVEPVEVEVGCVMCGVEVDDDCSMDCPSRYNIDPAAKWIATYERDGEPLIYGPFDSLSDVVRWASTQTLPVKMRQLTDPSNAKVGL